MVRKGLLRLSPCPASSEGRVLVSPPHSPVGWLLLSDEESEALGGPGRTCLGLQNFEKQAAPPLASAQHPVPSTTELGKPSCCPPPRSIPASLQEPDPQ